MVSVIREEIGNAPNPLTGKEEPVYRFTLTNATHMKVQIITLGNTITSIKVPDYKGDIHDVVLGFDHAKDYLSKENPYFGATIGRVCNRVANGRFSLPNGRTVDVSRNWKQKHQLHGGFQGFDKMHWLLVATHADGISLQHISPDGHEGYPGQVTVIVRYRMPDNENKLWVTMEAETTLETPVNLTNHSYFNLAGHNAGKEAIYEHLIQIHADRILETDADSIPSGRYKQLNDLPAYDFRRVAKLGDRLQSIAPVLGFDDNYCLLQDPTQAIPLVARALHPGTHIMMEVSTDQPGLQFYTSNFMPDEQLSEPPIVGKGGALYRKHGAFCMETQIYPDAVNQPAFPKVFLKPQQQYRHEVIYKFSCISPEAALFAPI